MHICSPRVQPSTRWMTWRALSARPSPRDAGGVVCYRAQAGAHPGGSHRAVWGQHGGVQSVHGGSVRSGLGGAGRGVRVRGGHAGRHPHRAQLRRWGPGASIARNVNGTRNEAEGSECVELATSMECETRVQNASEDVAGNICMALFVGEALSFRRFGGTAAAAEASGRSLSRARALLECANRGCIYGSAWHTFFTASSNATSPTFFRFQPSIIELNGILERGQQHLPGPDNRVVVYAVWCGGSLSAYGRGGGGRVRQISPTMSFNAISIQEPGIKMRWMTRRA